MAATLIRADRARGMVADCLAKGRDKQAHAVCRMHYSARGSPGNLACDKDKGSDVSSSSPSALVRFVKEFSLDAPNPGT